MSITTFATLKAAIASYLERDDLTSQIPTFHSLATSKMYRGVIDPRDPSGRTWLIPPLRIRDMITTASITVTAGVGALPTGWLEFVRLKGSVTDSPNWEYTPIDTYWQNAGAYDSDNDIVSYTIEGSSIRTLPAGSDTALSVHYAQFTAMSADSDHDWIIDNAPHVYLHGALMEAWNFIGGNEGEEIKQAGLFSGAIKGLNAQYAQSQHRGGAVVARPRAVA